MFSSRPCAKPSSAPTSEATEDGGGGDGDNTTAVPVETVKSLRWFASWIAMLHAALDEADEMAALIEDCLDPSRYEEATRRINETIKAGMSRLREIEAATANPEEIF